MKNYAARYRMTSHTWPTSGNVEKDGLTFTDSGLLTISVNGPAR